MRWLTTFFGNIPDLWLSFVFKRIRDSTWFELDSGLDVPGSRRISLRLFREIGRCFF